MSTLPETDFATQIMNAAIAYDTPAAPPAPALSPAETIADLERQIKKLTAEVKATKKRAADRYTQMLHATRYAERTQEALKRETEAKLDSELKAARAFALLNKKVEHREHDNEQAQMSARLHTHLEELYASKTRLQADLAQKTKELGAAQQSLQKLSSKFQEDKEQIRLQATKTFNEALAERQKLWKEESAAAAQKQAQELESIRKENGLLKEQLQKSQQALEWHKAQLQQQSAQRKVVQSSPMAAGIHAGFPLTTQQSPPQATDQRKRRRLNSTGNASLPTSEQQAGNTNNVVTPTRRKAPVGGRQPSQNPTTPTRLPQGLILNAGPMQPHLLAKPQPQPRGLTEAFVQSRIKTPAQIQAEVQAIVTQSTHEGTLQQFQQFVTSVNARHQQAGRSPPGTVALWHAFKAWSTQQAGNQQPGGIQFVLHSPFQASVTPFTSPVSQPSNNQSPFSHGVPPVFGVAQQMQIPSDAQYPAQFQNGNLYPSPPEDLHGDPSANGFTNLAEVPMAAPPLSTRSSTPVTRPQDFPTCLHCYEKWWHETCDAGEPCQNCALSSTACERPKCHLKPGECTNARCWRVHEGDTRFRYVVPKPKMLKREGKKDEATDSPVVVFRKQHSTDVWER